MNAIQMEKIFKDTMYVHTSGTKEELEVARYLQNVCAEWGLQAQLDPFEVSMATINKAVLLINGEEIPCKGYFLSGSADIEAPLYFLHNEEKASLAKCKGKIVLLDGGVRYWLYQDLLENGAVGFITYNGDIHSEDTDIEQKELRPYISNGKKIPGVSVHAKDMVKIIDSRAASARIILEQDEYTGTSHNVVLDLPGQTNKMITLTAHYDTTPLSPGSYDNMSGCVVLLGIAQYFSEHPHRYSLRFIWCGSEERGLLGSKAYCANHEDQLADMDLVVNVDMIGCLMGRLGAICTSENDLASYIKYMAKEVGYALNTSQDIYSSDSTPFADKGIPAVSFARGCCGGTGAYHSKTDTFKVISLTTMQEDTDFVIKFVDRMANAAECPVERTIPDNVKEKIDKYLMRKR